MNDGKNVLFDKTKYPFEPFLTYATHNESANGYTWQYMRGRV